MILIITNSQDKTADYFAGQLLHHGVEHSRINTECALEDTRIQFAVADPRIKIRQQVYRASEVSAIWYRRPRPIIEPPLGDKAERAHIAGECVESLEGFLAHIPAEKWINHPANNALASRKLEQLTRAHLFGFSVPRTLVTQDVDEARQFWRECSGRVITKPISSGYLERNTGDTSIYTSRVHESHMQNVDLVSRCPTLFQLEVEKAFDIRATVVDGQARYVQLSGQKLDIRRDNMRDVSYRMAVPPKEIHESLIAILRSYALRFAAVDFVVDGNGRWWFLEINPNGQWAWLDIEVQAGIAELLCGACCRGN
ncbi:MAG TPA: hypothetical protein PK668_12620 [Myxococcota bacterium]|nr:hypothetical protein [Myxococcota bacterium]HRY93686.1 hypothetical protein [Myxococcota bacterium]